MGVMVVHKLRIEDECVQLLCVGYQERLGRDAFAQPMFSIEIARLSPCPLQSLAELSISIRSVCGAGGSRSAAAFVEINASSGY